MKPALSLAATLVLAGCAAPFTHVEPGQSAMFARARKADFVAPALSEPPPFTGMGAVEPALPDAVPADTLNDYFALGTFCLQQGRDEEAAAAFQKAVQLDPNYADAWNSLAICYQNTGDSAKALDAFKKYKTLTAQ